MIHFIPCDRCARHLRASEVRCPFCEAPVVALPAGPLPAERLSRAALFAFGAAVLGSGCVSGDRAPPPTTVARPEQPPPAGNMPVYGGPPAPPPVVVTDAPAPQEPPRLVEVPRPPPAGIMPAYGGPPRPRTPPPPPDPGSFAARYGAPPRPGAR